LAIADHAARSEIELYAEQTTDTEGRRLFNTMQPREESVDEESLVLVAKAAHYIELRGASLPYRLHRLDSYLWFEDPVTAVSLEDQLTG
jgi:protocatechuate 3,4-dioxygenase beta subunit